LNLSLDEAQRFRAFAGAGLALVSVPMAAFLDTLASRSGSCILISSSFTRSLLTDWPHYIAAKSAVEGLVSWAAANFKSIRFIIARPPRLLTDQMNTPTDRQGALPVEGAAAAIVDRRCDTSDRQSGRNIRGFLSCIPGRPIELLARVEA
jgi:hypothetical protein